MRKALNIVLIMCDDLGYGDTGFNGNKIIQTPHLDHLRNQGARFTRFYSGGPVCSPTRGTCLTGRHYSRYGITHANVGRLPGQEITLAKVLKSYGYATGHFGKWHLGTLDPEFSGKPNRNPAANFAPPWERDYDTSFTTEYAVPTWDPGRDFHSQNYSRNDTPWASPYYDNGNRIEDMLLGCDSKHIADKAIDFIRLSTKAEKPFFTTVWFHAPHAPVEAGPEYLEMYREYHIDEAHYYGVVTAMDEQVGRIMSAIYDLDVTDHTMVWFCSDNGPEGSENLQTNGRNRGVTAGLRGRKRSLFNGGVGVPALISWPGVVPAGCEYQMPCSTLDYFPTISELIGYTLPDSRPIDGISLLPMLRGQNTERYRPIPFRFIDRKDAMFGSPTFGIIDTRYKYLTNFSEDMSEDAIFDLVDDPFEQRNIISLHRDFADEKRRELKDMISDFESSHYGENYNDLSYQPTTPFQGIGEAWR